MKSDQIVELEVLAPKANTDAEREAYRRMREAFGDDAMLLIGGSLLAAGDGLEMRCRAFVAAARPSRTAATPGEARA